MEKRYLNSFFNFLLSTALLVGTLFTNSGFAQTDADCNGREDHEILALYTFYEGSGIVVHDVSGATSGGFGDHDLVIQDPENVTWLSGGGLRINASTIIKGIAGGKIFDDLDGDDEVAIEAWVRPSSTTQGGPARIMTLSQDINNRNFTLGQEGNQYVVRLRTDNEGDNNGMPELYSGAGTATTSGLTHIVYSRGSNGEEELYINGVEVASFDRDGDFDNWDAGYTFAIGNEHSMDRPWLGEIHLIAVYDDEFSSSDVQQNYNAGPCTNGTGSGPFAGPSTPNCSNGNFLWSQTVDVNDLNGSGIPNVDLRFVDGGTFTIPGPYPSAFNSAVTVSVSEAISWDGYTYRATTSAQSYEKWRVVFKKNGSVVHSTSYTGDLADGVISAEWSGSLGGSVYLPNGTDEILLVHYEDGTYGNGSASTANSVVPVSVCISYSGGCDNVTDAGLIGYDQTGCYPFDPVMIQNLESPSGGSGALEYVWLESTNGGSSYTVIPGANSDTYDPPVTSVDKWYRRCARRAGCTTYVGESNWIHIDVDGACSNNCNDAIVAYGGQCADSPDAFYVLSSEDCVSSATNLSPINGSSNASCDDDIICVGSYYNPGWEFSFEVNGNTTINGANIDLLYPIDMATAGGASNNSNCPTTFNYYVEFYKNNTLIETVNGSIPSDVIVTEMVNLSSPLVLSNGDEFKVQIKGNPTNNSCDLFENAGTEVVGCCGPDCDNVTDAGLIGFDQQGCYPFDPVMIQNLADASGGSGALEYIWLESMNGGSSYTVISGATDATYDPTVTSVDKWYRRCARRAGCTAWVGESNWIHIDVDGECPTDCSDALVAYGGQCADSPDAFYLQSSESCIGSATNLYPINGSSSASCDDDIICVASFYNPGWEFSFVANANTTIHGANIDLLYPIYMSTAGGGSNSTSCPSTFNYYVEFYLNDNLLETVNGSIPADVIVTEVVNLSSPLVIQNGDEFKVQIKGSPLNSSCDLFENAGTEVIGCCGGDVCETDPPTANNYQFEATIDCDDPLPNVTFSDASGIANIEYSEYEANEICQIELSSYVTYNWRSAWFHAFPAAYDKNFVWEDGYVVVDENDVMRFTGRIRNVTLQESGFYVTIYSEPLEDWNTWIAGGGYDPGDSQRMNRRYAEVDFSAPNSIVGFGEFENSNLQLLDNGGLGHMDIGPRDVYGGYGAGIWVEYGGYVNGMPAGDNLSQGQNHFDMYFGLDNCIEAMDGCYGLTGREWVVTDNCGNQQTFVQGVHHPLSCDLEPTCSSTNGTCDNGNVGTASVSVTGGEAPYTYLWDNGSTSSSISGLSAGQYCVTVTDANGCEVECCATVTTQPVCCDNVTDPGEIAADQSNCGPFDPAMLTSVSAPSGGSGALEIIWITRQGTSGGWTTIPGATGLTYDPPMVTTTTQYRRCARREGCTSWVGESNIITITVYPALTASCNGENGDCSNGNVGSASVSVSGGTAPFSYAWSNGGSGSSISNLQPGTYSVTVTDVNGCSDNCSVTITNESCCNVTDPGEIAANGSGCAPFDPPLITSVSLPSGGIGTIEYIWIMRTGTSGPWTTIPGANGPTYDPPVITETTQYRRCARRSGCTSWVGESNIITMTVTGPCCDNVTDGGEIAEDQSNCGPFDPDMLTSVSAPSGGSGNLEIIWLRGTCGTPVSTWTVIPGATGLTYDPGYLTQTTCFIRCSRREGCSAYVGESNIITITVYPNDMVANCTSTDGTCNNGNVGSASVNVTGGTAPYTYLWSTGATTMMISNLTAGSYSVQVTDANGCTTSCSTTVTTTPCCNVTDGGEIAADQENCGPFDPDAFTSVAPATGGLGDLEYVWLWNPNNVPVNNGNNGWTVIPGATGETYDPGYLTESRCFIRCARRSGCTVYVGESNVICVTINPEPVATCSKDNGNCSNNNQGTASVSVSGGTAPFSYLWNTGATSSSISGLSAGTYSVTVTDANGCMDDCSVTITTTPCCNVTDPGEVADSQSDCGPFDPAPFTSVAPATGGIGAVEYQWFQKETETSWMPIPGATNETYDAPFTNVNMQYRRCARSQGCTDWTVCSNILDITINPEPVATCSKVDGNCNNNNEASASVSVAGGTAPYTYLWNTGATTSSISGLTAGTYSVTVTDDNGCTDDCSVTVSTTPCCNVTDGGEIAADQENCGPFDPDAFTSVSDPTGGLGNLEIIWLMSTNCGAPISQWTVIPGATGLTYDHGMVSQTTCFIRCARREGCTQYVGESNIITVTVNPQPTATCSKVDGDCNNGNMGSASVSASGGTAPYTYMWSTGATSSSITGLSAGTYSVTVTDANGCTDDCSVTVTIEGCCNVTDGGEIAADQENCGPFDPATFTSVAPATGGLGELEYVWLWNPNNVPVNNGNNGWTIIPGATGETYDPGYLTESRCFIRCARRSGCTVYVGESNVICVTINPEPTATCTKVDGNCNNNNLGSASVSASGGTAPYSYLWNTGATSFSISGLSAGTYSVTVTDANGCTDDCSVTITTTPCCNVTDGGEIAADQDNCGPFDPDAFTSVSDPSGGLGNLEIIWLRGTCGTPVSQWTEIPGANGLTYDPGMVTQTTCFIRCSRREGCTTWVGESNIITITVHPNDMVATCSMTPVDCNGGSDGTATASVTGGTAPYSYAWSNGGTTATITGLGAGTYSVTVTDANGCSTDCFVEVTEPSDLTATCSSDNGTCANGNLGSASVTAGGGTAPYTYLWSTGATTMMISNLTAGSYSVQVTDANGCIEDCSVTITTVPCCNVTDPGEVADSQSDCGPFDPAPFTSVAPATGGIGAVEYQWFQKETETSWMPIPGATNETYDAPFTNVNMQYRRCARSQGCTDWTVCSNILDITINPEPVATCTPTNGNCNNNNEASASVSVAGGTAPYTYLWNTGATTSSISGLTAGTYSVTVTDANGCTDDCSVTVTTTPCCNVTDGGEIAADQENCGPFDPDAFTSVSDPTGGLGNLEIIWLMSTNCGAPISQWTVIPGATGLTYDHGMVSQTTCFIRCARREGCTQYVGESNIITVTVNDEPVATCSSTDGDCNNNNEASASVSVSGGTAPYTYMWNTGATTATISNIAAGTYSVTVTDANGCTDECSVTVTTTGCCNVTDGGEIAADQENCGPFDPDAFTSVTDPSGGLGALEIIWLKGTCGTPVSQWDVIAGATGLTYDPGMVTQTTCFIRCSRREGCTTWVGESNIITITVHPDVMDATCSMTPVDCNGGSTGTATVAVTTGTAPYSYAWSNGGTTATITGLSAGTYSVTVTDANGCSDNCSVEVTQPSNLTVSCDATDVDCHGNATGTATMTPSGGTGPYTYSWHTGQTTATITGLTAGSYNGTVTDANGCTASCQATVYQEGPLTATCTGSDLDCEGDSDGTASVAAGGGTHTYTYLWNTGATTASISGLTAGTYTVTVTDDNGCTATCEAVVTEPAELTAQCTSTNGGCNNNNAGTATVTAGGGTAPYTYLWSTGATTATITGLGSGTYSAEVTDANGCVVTCQTTVVVEPCCNVTDGGEIAADQENCGPFDPDAFTSVSDPSGGLGNLEIIWLMTTNCNAPVSQWTVIPGATGLTYDHGMVQQTTCFIRCSRREGCTQYVGESNIITVTVHDEPVATCSSEDGDCNNNNEASASVGVSGGTAPYTYAWSNGASTASISGLAAGTYSVTITDANGCADECSVTVSTTDCCNVTDGGEIAADQENCGPFDPDAFTSVEDPSGGLGDLEIIWLKGTCGTSVSTWDEIPGANGLTYDPGMVTETTCFIRCSRREGCTVWIGESNIITITVHDEPVATCSSENGDCQNGNMASASVSVNGGTAPYSYAWSNGETTASISGLAAGTYSVTVTDANGCTDECSVTVTIEGCCNVTDPGEIAASQSGCGPFDPVEFTSVSPATGGIGDVEYQWFQKETETSWMPIPGATEETYDPGMIYINMRFKRCARSVGCTEWTECSNALDIEIHPEPVANCSSTPVDCAGGSNGTASVTALAGTGPYSYLWSNGGTTETITGLTAGSYSVVVTDQNGCVAECSTTVMEPGVLTASCTGEDGDCNNGNSGSASVTPNGGVAPYSYMWSNGETTASISGLGSGTYTATVTDGSGCSATCSVTITANGCCNVTNGGEIAANQENCGSFDPDAFTSVSDPSGGLGNLEIIWLMSTDCSAPISQWTVIPGATGLTYDHGTVSETTCFIRCARREGCTQYVGESNIITVTVNDGPSVTCDATDADCNGAANGTATANVSGGTAPYTYMWSTGATTMMISNLTAGSYVVTVTDAEGCTAECTAVVEEPAALTADCSSDNGDCNNMNEGSASVTANGGTAPYSYAWSNGESTASISGLAAGTYSVTVTDANGCVADCSVDITTTACCNLTDGGMIEADQSDCGPFDPARIESVTEPTGGLGNMEIIWLKGMCGTPITTWTEIPGANGLSYDPGMVQETTCFIRCARREGCTTYVGESNIVTITVHPEVNDAMCSMTEVSGNGGNDGTATVAVTSGTPPYTYAWSNGGTTATITGLTAGMYSVVVTDANGCSDECEVEVTEPNSLDVTCEGTNGDCNNNNEGTASVSATGGVPPYTYAWSNGETTQSISGLAAGTYTATVTDVNGNTGSCSYTVETEACCNVTDGGEIAMDQEHCGPFDPDMLTSVSDPSGGLGNLEIIWLSSTDCNAPISQWDVIAGATDLTYDPGTLDETTCFIRCARREGCTVYVGESNIITITVGPGCCDNVTDGGEIAEDQENCGPFDPEMLTNVTLPSGGSGDLEYVWLYNFNDVPFNNGQNGWVEIPNSNSENYDPGMTTQTTYFLRCSRRSGCTPYPGESNIVTITVHPNDMVATCSTDPGTCNNNNEGSASVDVTGGTAPYTYAWSNGETTQSISGLAAGTYTVAVTDAGGCSATCDVTVETTPCCNVTDGGEIAADQENCGPFDPDMLTSVSDPSGGLGNLEIIWLSSTDCNAPISQWDVIAGATGLTYDPGALDETTCFIRCARREGCTAYVGESNIITITVGPGCCDNVTDGGEIAEDQENCGPFDPDMLTSVVDPTGGSGDLEYVWLYNFNDVPFNNGQNGWVEIPNSNSATYDTGMTTQTTYFLRCSRRSGCTPYPGESNIVTITVHPSDLSADCDATAGDCQNNNEGSASVTAAGGTAPYSYSWSNGETTASISGLAAGTYTVTVTDANGCSATCDAVVETEGCCNVTDGGEIAASQENCGPFDPDAFTSVSDPSGGLGDLEIIWLRGTCGTPVGQWDVIPGATGLTYDPGMVTETTCFIRCSRREGCTVYMGESNIITITVHPSDLTADCNATAGDCQNNNEGSASVTVNGGTAPYSYSWSNGETTASISGLAAGTYTVTVTDANGCSATCDAVVETEGCCDVTDGGLIAEDQSNCGEFDPAELTSVTDPSGGLGALEIIWITREGTSGTWSIIPGADGLTYDPGVVSTTTQFRRCARREGCPNYVAESNIITITVYPAPIATCEGEDGDCNNGNMASASVSVAGGTAPYTYLWSNGETTEMISGLASGTYTVVVTDANGCEDECSVTVESSDCCNVTDGGMIAADQSHCEPFDPDAFTSVSDPTGGLGNLEIIWLSGECGTPIATWSEIPGANGLTYDPGMVSETTCFIRCARREGCSTWVGESNIITITVGDGCCDNVTDGGIIAENQENCGPFDPDMLTSVTDPTGGSGDLEIIWLSTTDCNLPVGQWDVIAGATGLTYDPGMTTETTCYIRCSRREGCTTYVGESNIITITVNPGDLDVTCSSEDGNCQNNNEGSASVSASGGEAPYTYLWSNGETTADISGLAAGSYSVVVTDANGCSADCSVTVETAPCCNVTDGGVIAENQSNCGAFDPAELISVVDPSGGIGDLEIIWLQGTCGTPIALWTEIPGATGLSYDPGMVTETTCFIRCARRAGCTSYIAESNIITIVVNGGPTATCSAEGVMCYGDQDGSASVSVSGGEAPYTYAWSNGGSTETIDGLAAGDYTVEVTDANGCTTSCIATVEGPEVELHVMCVTTDGNCENGNTGTATGNVEGGTPPYSYLWSNGDTTMMVEGLDAGTYTVTVTDANGCVSVCTAVVETSGCCNVTDAGEVAESQTGCGPFDPEMFTSVTPATGGVGEIQYQWFQKETETAWMPIPGATDSVYDAGLISINSQFKRCAKTADCPDWTMCSNVIEIEILPVPEVFIQVGEENMCTDGFVTLTAISVSATSYMWTTGDTTQSIQVSAGGSYGVVVMNEFDCEAEAPNVEIEEGNCPPLARNDFNNTTVDTPVDGDVSTNDSDPDGDPLTFTQISTPSNGTVSFNPDGTYTYTPNPGFVGEDEFNYVTCDDGVPSLCDSATVYIEVIDDPKDPYNNPPVANPDDYVTYVDVPFDGTVITNDFDPDTADIITVTSVIDGPSNGTLTGVNPDGTFNYSPNPGFVGDDSFTYVICDNGTPGPLCDTAIAVIHVLEDPDSQNVPPVAVDDAYVTDMDVPVDGDASLNDYDLDGDSPLTFSQTSNPSNGSVVFNNDGSFTYTPGPGYAGPDNFTYEVCDGISGCDAATVYITILSPANRPPVARNDFNNTLMNTPVDGDVSTNDSDPDGDNLTFTQLTDPSNGTITSFNPDGTYTYDPNPGFVGTDSYTYNTCDDGVPSMCDTATVYIEVIPPHDPQNNPPVANPDDYVTYEDTPFDGTVIPNDFDPDTGDVIVVTEVISGPSNGTITGVNPDGTFNYSPDPGFVGDDEFTYVICDNGNPGPLCDTTIAVIHVLEDPFMDNLPPVAVDDAYITQQDTPVDGDASLNDYDLDGDTPLTFAQTSNPSNGSVVFNPDGTFTYTPNPGYVGPDHFTYEVCDGISGCDEATVYITIECIMEIALVPTPLSCFEVEDGSIDLTVSCANEPITYLWSNGETTEDISGLAAGWYSVTVTDAYGISLTDSVEVTQPDDVEVMITPDGPTEFCEGGSVALSATPGFVTYLWGNGETTMTTNVSTDGLMTVLVTDSAGCEGRDEIYITVYPNPEVVIEITDGQNPACDGETIELTAVSATATSYLWSTGDSTAVIDVTMSGTYTVEVADSNGCMSSASIEIIVNPNPEVGIQITSGNNPMCEGESVDLIAFSATASGWSWSTGDNTPSTTVTEEGWVSIEVIDQNGCTATDSIYIEVNPLPEVEIQIISGTNPFCEGDSLMIQAMGDSTLSYMWDDGQTTASILITEAGQYCVTAIDTNGCMSTACYAVEVNELPEITIDIDGSNPFCEGDSITLMASSPAGLTYVWGNGTFGQNLTVDAAGTYCIMVVDSNGCANEACIDVEMWLAPELEIEVTDGSNPFCDGDTIELSAIAPDAVAWVWSTGETTSSINVSEAGTYCVMITDQNGCTSEACIDVEVAELPEVVVEITDGNNPFCDGDQIELTAVSPTATQWMWDGGLGNGPSIIVDETGTYSVTVSDQLGCSNTASIDVEEVPNPEPEVTSDGGTVFCEGEGLTLTVTADDVVSVQWSVNGDDIPGATSETYYAQESGDYCATVTNSNGCEGTACLKVSQVDVPTVNAGVDVSICEGDSTTLTAIASDPTATFEWSLDGTVLGTDPSITVSPGVGITEYTVTISTEYCDNQDLDVVKVTVNGYPEADFSRDPAGIVAHGDNVEFTDETDGIVTEWHWDFGDGETSMLQNPVHMYDALGVYDVTLIASNNGCADTVSMPLEVQLLIQIPDPITPNDDGFNDAVWIDGGPNTDLTMTIYNRWGHLVWTQTGRRFGWDGRSNAGVKVESGTYYYVLNVKNNEEQVKYDQTGYITVIR